MSRQSVVEDLCRNLPKDVKTVPTRHRAKDSDWSLSFKSEIGKELDTLVNIFDLRRDKRLEDLFASATSGDGDEKSKILTLHSSSLLAFLCFSHVNKTCPVTICGTKYVEVMFEVKNDVINQSLGKPSNIDVALLNDDRSEILFLESKFTEYLNGGRAYLSPERYKEFFDEFFDRLQSSHCSPLVFEASYMDVSHKPDSLHPHGYTSKEYCLHQGATTTDYLGGIKQAFSHLLGIATGPAQCQTETNSHYAQIFKEVRKITFASIVNNCDGTKFKPYSELYNSVFRHEELIKKSIRTVISQSNNIDKLNIHPSLITYQEIFKSFPLSQQIRSFYNFNDYTHA